DFEKYPRPLEKDLELAKSRGADVVFHPSVEEIYPEHFQTLIEVTELSKPLCGLYRLGHFRGVATVVLKLFNIVQPDVALFGEKDYQQLQIIRRMAKDLHLDVEIIGVPTVRVSGGLAMSSRNQYLSSEELKSAIALSKALNKAQELVDEGMIDAIQIIEILREMIEQERECKVQYISICHPETLERMTRVREKALIAMSVFCGETRLIDNRIIKPNEKTI
ncbi:MAG TPA: pantoate--beta-alanine ligase, partial [Bdellovibrionota bacterium]|nr:pantoate--beta-alanine ligase [Bdellovibrionota bacterium]